MGFVTVTAVETAPDLRRARVFARCSGWRGAQALDAGAPVGARRAPAVVARELRLKHTPTLEFVYDDTSERGMRIAQLIDGGRRAVRTRNGVKLSRDSSSTCCARTTSSATTHEHPNGDALGSLAALQHVPTRWARTPSRSCARSSCPRPTSTSSSSCGRSKNGTRRAAGTRRARHEHHASPCRARAARAASRRASRGRRRRGARG